MSKSQHYKPPRKEFRAGRKVDSYFLHFTFTNSTHVGYSAHWLRINHYDFVALHSMWIIFLKGYVSYYEWKFLLVYSAF